MRWLWRILLVLVLLVGVLGGAQQYAAESGEVVVMTAAEQPSEPVSTRLWVVDYDGSAWLRAGSADAGWYQRLLVAETVTVERGGVVGTFVATPEHSSRAVIDQAMRAKYGWADRFISALFGGRENGVAIRLSPLPS